jgi:hypothetical protein
VNNGKLLIADLGLSKKLAEVKTNSMANEKGVIEYTDPRCFKNIKYKKNKESDIYSLGVLFWEISSGRFPFSDCLRCLLKDHIKDGNREEPIEGTPPEYQKLYQKCWDGEPELRPDIDKVYETLRDLQSPQPDTPDDQSESEDDDFYFSSDFLDSNSKSKFNYLAIYIG